MFNQELLKQIGEENIDVRDLFKSITDNVYRNSNRRQRPLSIDGLPKGEAIYLNEVYRPPECPMVDIDPNELKGIQERFAKMKEHFSSFPDIDVVMDDNNPDIRQAQGFTDSIISQIPSGNVTDRSTACHVMYEILGGKRKECLFYDSKKGMSLPLDASTNLVGLSNNHRPLVLNLRDSRGLGDENYVRVDQHELKLAHTLNLAVDKNQSHPVMDDIVERLAQALGVHKNEIIIETFYEGSCNIIYTLKHLSISALRKLQDVSSKLRRQFPQFVTARIHPLLYRPAFDISFFDEHGNKTFSDDATTFEIGPPGKTQTYIQPYGWTRYGLKVVGRYSDDRWLEPFRDTRNWYRAFYGTGHASRGDVKGSNVSSDKQYAELDAVPKILEKGFLPAYGEGIYCSPNPQFPEKDYVSRVCLDTKEGRKTFKCMLQVAVNPYGVHIKTKDIWLVPKPEDIRTYGILIKEDN